MRRLLSVPLAAVVCLLASSVALAAPPGSSGLRTSAHRGWVGVWLDVPDVDWDELAGLVTDAHELIARARRR